MLKIKNIQKEDRGIYLCQSWNLVGFGSVWTVKIAVRCNFFLYFVTKKKKKKHKKFNLVSPHVSCQRAIGQAPNFEVDAYMECFAYGYPAPRLRLGFTQSFY